MDWEEFWGAGFELVWVHDFCWLYRASPCQRWRNSIQTAKTRPGMDCGSDHELLIAKFRLKLKKVEKTTRPREFQKNISYFFIDYAKAFDCVDQNKLWKIIKKMGIPDNLNCLLWNLYLGQEATVRTGHGTTDWFQIRNGVCQAVYYHHAY